MKSLEHTATTRQRGLAIGMILMAVTLLAALGIAIFYASKTQPSNETNMPHKSATASVLIAQARAIREGVDLMTGRGLPIKSLTFDTTSNTGLFNPSTGALENQIPPPEGLTQTSAWVWKVDGSGNPVVKLNNYGISSNADYVIALPYLDIYTCIAINNTLYNNPGIPTLAAGAATDWSTPGNSVDLSASNSGTQGRSEGCFWDANGSEVVYIAGIRAQ